MKAQTKKLKTIIRELDNIVGQGKVRFMIQDTSSLPESKKPIHHLLISKIQKKFANNKKVIPSQGSVPDSLIPFDKKENNDF